ncbi:hypothetical protein SORDD16_01789 [Streptococcus oralis]|uniref:Uncharacterized protein n=1 Tax=Streptococcus oralis TaxID=1303 RepID=A0A139RM28_STROR|nr:hypothetical protein SORDD16_01789 [Streptococcus oralis]KXU15776.1 hypothetical protein SORDD17_00918 [Streptococcus oralis]
MKEVVFRGNLEVFERKAVFDVKNKKLKIFLKKILQNA